MQDVARLPGSRMTRIRKSTVCAWPERAEKDTGPVCGGPKRGTKRGGGRRKMKGREKKKRKKGRRDSSRTIANAFNVALRGKDDPLSSGWLSSSKKSKAPRQITINRR